jgi:HPt (histidine-containing phosphotransfer) domain-containing protein
MSMKDLLAELQKDYLASFPDKVANLRKLFQENNLEDLQTEYHKLKGTGRTYGVPEVSQLGGALERLCEEDSDSLMSAVPLSLLILDRIRVSRGKGLPLNLDDDRDFQTIIELVVAPRKPGSSKS